MRTLILSIGFLFTLNSLQSQNKDLALLDTDTVTHKTIETNDDRYHSLGINSNYLAEKKHYQSSKIVRQWGKRLAYFNIENTSVFDNTEKAVYTISFKNKQVNIRANYNDNGEILSTKETYNNIKIPIGLKAVISKSYPGTKFLKNTYCVTFRKNSGIDDEYYLVKISQENKKMTLKFDGNFKLLKRGVMPI